MEPAAPPTRHVPGAPPPLPLTKSQLKKRKKVSAAKKSTNEDAVNTPKDAALIDHVPTDIPESLVEEKKTDAPAAPEPELHASTIALETQKTPSPIVDQIINRRIKALGKKIVRSLGHDMWRY